MRSVFMKGGLVASVSAGVMMMASAAVAATCPVATVKDMKGLKGAFPQQFELSELSCTLNYAQNPDIAALNKRIIGNAALPAVQDRLPQEPLVVAPYDEAGSYGGVLQGLSKATESGTSDLLSVRHVNFVRYSDDTKTIVPNIAKSWAWNSDFTELTMVLRKGHKWSDGAPFTAEDVVFWYEDLILNSNVYEKTPGRWLFDGKPMKIEAVDATTVKMSFPAPAPGILNRFAVDYGQPFQPKHFLKKFHGKYNADADKLAQEKGLKDWPELLKKYYGSSDWKDVPTPLLSKFDNQVVPTLESHIVVEDTATGRQLVANPYFHQVDTAGNQLPYINEIQETYVKDLEVQNLKITNGEVTFKQQAVFLENFPLLKENESRGGYKVELAPALGVNVFYSFNTTHKDPELRKIFDNVEFRKAMSIAMDRDEINEIAWLGQGTPQQSLPVEHSTVNFVKPEQLELYVQKDIAKAREMLAGMGLKDSDGDGVLERFDGKPLVVRLVYANQGAPVKMHELVRDYWASVGVRVDLKEVTSDEYRSAASNNDLDITVWKLDNISGPTVSQTPAMFFPPFGNFFNPGTGFEWAAWKTSNGKQGVEPPADVKRLWDLSEMFVQQPLGTAKSDEIGAEIVKIHLDNLWKIGTVGEIKDPVVYRDDLKNFRMMTVKTYDFYWAYPYRPSQWYLAK